MGHNNLTSNAHEIIDSDASPLLLAVLFAFETGASASGCGTRDAQLSPDLSTPL